MTSRKASPVYVTRPLLPPLEEFIPYLEQIWEDKWLTNNGPFHQQFEQALCDHLGARHVSLFANGTLALGRWHTLRPPSPEIPPFYHPNPAFTPDWPPLPCEA